MSNPILNNQQAPLNQVNNQGNILEALKKSSPQLKEMANQMKSLNSGDLNQMLGKTLGQNNPMMQALMGGGNPEQLVRAELEKQGINVNEFMSTLTKSLN